MKLSTPAIRTGTYATLSKTTEGDNSTYNESFPHVYQPRTSLTLLLSEINLDRLKNAPDRQYKCQDVSSLRVRARVDEIIEYSVFGASSKIRLVNNLSRRV